MRMIKHIQYSICGKKTDKKDAEWIADLFKRDLVAGNFIPLADICQLRDLSTIKHKSADKKKIGSDIPYRSLH